MKRKILALSLSFGALFFLFIFFEGFAKDNNFSLLTKPYLKILSDAEIKGTLSLVSEKGIKGKILLSPLSEQRTYILPDSSGEICLSSGNCVFQKEGGEAVLKGTQNRLAKFGEGILLNSSIEDLGTLPKIFIDEQGNLGIGIRPESKLHVAGKIQAKEDVCTELRGGICLSQLQVQVSQIEKPTSLKEATIEGAGTPETIPLWKKDYQLGDSVIYQQGENIGIGMIPSYKLDVAGTIRVLGFRLPVSPKEGYGLVSDDSGFGTWRPVLAPLSPGGDVAELFPVKKECEVLKNCPEAGDLVCLQEDGFLEKCKERNERLLGVVSENPTLTMKGEKIFEKAVPVALLGKVKAKASLLNGEIEIGDPLTSSFVEGVSQKATQKGKIIGFALQSLKEDDFKNCNSEKVFDCSRKIGKIEVLISLQYFNP